MELFGKIFPKALLFGMLLCIASCSPNYLKDFKLLNNSDLKIPTIFNHDFQKSLYKAKLTIRGRELSGVLIVKRINKSGFRIVFMSEIGLKYFDFGIEYGGEEFMARTYYIMPVLNRGEARDILINDFSLLLSDFKANRKPVVYRSAESKRIAVEYNYNGQVYICFRQSGSDRIGAVKWKSRAGGRSGINIGSFPDGIPSGIEITNKKYSLFLKLQLIEQ
ncbi:MAG: hypothetical protein GXO88_12280 [Chlorobi bacterium]|nr:hypothetical protein [Chlorobiota bacterium]